MVRVGGNGAMKRNKMREEGGERGGKGRIKDDEEKGWIKNSRGEGDFYDNGDDDDGREGGEEKEEQRMGRRKQNYDY